MQHIALVPEAEGVDFAELARVSAALQKQVTRDLSPAWGLSATVDAFVALDDVPIGYWPVILSRGELGRQAGVHLDDNGQPYAQVQLREHWSLAASRACLELLVNPFGTRNVTEPSLRADQGPVEFVVEACGPCDDARYAYSVNGVVVADFCFPAFYEPLFGSAANERLTFSGAAKTGLQPLPGGHLTWYDPIAGNYWLRSHWADNPIDTRLGAAHGSAVRELLNACQPLRAPSERRLAGTLEADAAHAQRASRVRGLRLRALLGRQMEAELVPALPIAEPEAPKLRARLPTLGERAASDPNAATAVAVEPAAEPVPRVPGAPAQPASVPPMLQTKTKHRPAKPARPATERARIPSLAPVSLPSMSGGEQKPRSKAPMIATIATAAAFALVWFSAHAARTAPRPHTAKPAVQQTHVAALPVAARPPAAEAPSDVLPQLVPDLEHAGATPQASAAAAPATAPAPQPAKHEQAAKPIAPATPAPSHHKSVAQHVAKIVPKVAAQAAAAPSKRELPPAPSESATKATVPAQAAPAIKVAPPLPSIEDLIGSRK